ncbi:MAG: cbb3-type cytochrome oxidase assembly protein CcoS [Opitutales bacterium]|nr:cbb3-type cytochrome oxidase assembly protein CcoS [Opitutales bacterium]
MNDLNQSWDIVIIILIVFGLLFFGIAAYALQWAAKNGQFQKFEKGSRVIFDEEEPEGEIADRFPSKKKPKAKH